MGIDETAIEVIPPGVGERWFAPCSPEAREAVRRWLGFDEPFLLHLGLGLLVAPRLGPTALLADYLPGVGRDRLMQDGVAG